MPKPVGLLIPTRIEAMPVIRALALKKAGSHFYRGRRGELELYLLISGVGMEAARAGAFRLHEEGAKILVSAGFCGSLSEKLRIGDVVRDRIASVRTPARTRQERQALTERANALAVDMETQAVIEAGTRRGVPIRMVRVVSDLMDDDLTPLLGKGSGFSPVAIAFRLLNPLVWPLARRLSAQSKIAKAKLVEALIEFLDKEAPLIT